MAETAHLYDAVFTALANKEIDWGSDDIRVILLAATYTPDQAAHNYLDDIVAHELPTAGGYTAGGVALTGKTEVITGHVKRFDADDVVLDPSTLSARYAAVVDRTPATDATRPLIGYVDFGEVKTSTTGEFKITWHADGIWKVTVS